MDLGQPLRRIYVEPRPDAVPVPNWPKREAHPAPAKPATEPVTIPVTRPEEVPAQ